jgi:excisionase family DNA binding protein
VGTSRYWTVADVAETYGLHPKSVYALVDQGKIPHLRVGRLLRFDPDEVRAHFARAAATAAG